jgi:hypothetical protein
MSSEFPEVLPVKQAPHRDLPIARPAEHPLDVLPAKKVSAERHPEVLPVEGAAEPQLLEPIPQKYLAPVKPVKKSTGKFRALVRGSFGWSWRWLIGAIFCMNPLNAIPGFGWFIGLVTSTLVMGWTYRWMQGRVIRNWWKKSRFAREGRFADYLASVGPDAPVARPRWFLRERIGATLHKPSRGGRPPSDLRVLLRCLTIPWYSLWKNFKTGFLALFCMYLITGWGCLLMYFGWIYGWHNSFHKVYEEAGVGIGISLLGYLLLILALFYVPMAQVHQAVTGEVRAFFQFRFVWRLIQARATAYCWLAAVIALLSVPLELLKIGAAGFGNDESLSDTQVLHNLQLYLFWSSVFLFAALLLARRLAARVYASAVLGVLRQGWVTRAELNPKLAAWLDRLEIFPVPLAATTGPERVAMSFIRWCYRVGGIYVVMFFIWLLFVAKVYVGEFFNYHPVAGFTNHELIQFPTFDLVPEHLRQSADKEQRAG